MSHFAIIDENNVVVNVLVIEQDQVDTGNFGDPATFIKTSYNIHGGVYYDPTTNLPAADQEAAINADEGRQRKNYAGIGCIYDATRNAFISVSPYPSWVINETTCQWEAPIAKPDTTPVGVWEWNEEAQEWRDDTTASGNIG